MKKKISKKTLSNLKNNLYKSVSFGDYKLFQNVCNSLVKYDYDLFEFIKITQITTIKNKFQKKYFYEIIDEYLFLQTFEKVYVVNKYKILEDKERIFVNKIKKLVIKNKENRIFYDNERYKLVKVNIQKELQKNEEFKKVC